MAYLHSIYFGAKGALPPQIEANIASLRRHHPQFRHTLYNEDSGRAFIARHFGPEVVEAFDELVPLAYKSDLLRLCLLHELGGIYADVSVQFFAPLETDTALPKLRIFRDTVNNAPWIVSTAIVCAPPRLAPIARSIDQIVANVAAKHYGFDPLSPTGPNLFGAQIAAWGKLSEMQSGDCASISRGNGGEAAGRAFLTPQGDLVAVIAKRRAGLGSLGAGVQDDYNEAWRRRKVYHSELAGPDRWTRRDYHEMGMINLARESTPDDAGDHLDAGCALFGPYVSLEAGDYDVRFIFAETGVEPPARVRIDVRCSGAEASPAIDVSPSLHVDGFAYARSFTLSEPRHSVETRLFLDGPGELTLLRMELAKRG